MDPFNLIVALLGGMILLLGLGSRVLSLSPFPPTLLALVLGVLIGPIGFGLLDPDQLGETPVILEKAARLTLGIGLVGVALRVPREYIRRNWRDMAILVGLGMLLMWAITTLAVYVILGLPFWLAALIGAIITPNDPVAASPIVTGDLAERNIPERLRNTISFESGANDGLSYLFVFLSFLLLTAPTDVAFSRWIRETLLWEVVLATFVGIAMGYAAGRLLQIAEARNAIKSQWRLVYTVALALLAVGAGRLIDSDEILLVFAAGAAFVQVVSGSERGIEERGQEAVNRFFAIPIFVLIGTAIPWEGWFDLGWRGMALVAAVLLLRRPPVILLLRPFLRNVHGLRESLFVGWFGPVAVAATYYASMMEHRLGEPVVWHAVSLVVCASVLVHGASGVPLTRWLGSRQERSSSGDGD